MVGMAALLCYVLLTFSQGSPSPAEQGLGHTVSASVDENAKSQGKSIELKAPAPETSPRLLMAVDGAGQFFTCSNACIRACMDHFPDVDVRPFLWSHGHRRYVADQRDFIWANAMSSRLASQILAWKQANPTGKVYLLGHSAGCGIALHAASELPPETLEKIVVMLPSCSTRVDLIGGIRATKYGVHVWCSDQDWVILGLMVRMFGCQYDTASIRAAGRWGFEPKPITDEEKTLVREKLRHYPWHQSQKRLGNDGGHYGAYRSPFLETIVLPNLFHAEVEPPYPVIEQVQEIP
jgi:hypothetical protein